MEVDGCDGWFTAFEMIAAITGLAQFQTSIESIDHTENQCDQFVHLGWLIRKQYVGVGLLTWWYRAAPGRSIEALSAAIMLERI